ncbi:MAG: hypothetical protein ACHP8A_13215 [Terriglobales bacterium]
MSKVLSRVALAAALFGSCALAGLTPANATTVTWNLASPGNTDPGSTTTFSSTVGPNTYTLGAAGFTSAWAATDLYIKAGGSGENGLGINNDPTGDHEIYLNTYVRLDTTAARSKGLTNFRFTIGSTTNGEGMDVYGSNSPNSGLTLLFSDIMAQPGLYNLSAYTYYYFTYDGAHVQSQQGDNVLLASFAGEISTTPLPAALPLFASALGALGLLGWRRKRKNAAAIAA